MEIHCEQEKQTIAFNTAGENKANELIRNRIMIVDTIKDKFTNLLVQDINSNTTK